jgi:hypothetical protein
MLYDEPDFDEQPVTPVVRIEDEPPLDARPDLDNHPRRTPRRRGTRRRLRRRRCWIKASDTAHEAGHLLSQIASAGYGASERDYADHEAKLAALAELVVALHAAVEALAVLLAAVELRPAWSRTEPVVVSPLRPLTARPLAAHAPPARLRIRFTRGQEALIA